MKQHSWKKQLLTAAVLGAITTIPATGMAAAAGGFDDVPHDNWSYGAIQTLLKDGVIDSFDDNTFNGQKIVTRFEMAQIVRRATNKAVNSTTLSDNDKALIIKLSQEYKKELTQLKSGSLSNSSASAGATMVRPGKNGIMDFSVLLLTDFVHDLLAPFAEICSLLLSYDGPKIGTSWCSRCQPSGHHGSSVSMTLRTRWSSMSFFPCWAALSRQWVQSLFTAREDPAE